MNILQGLRQWFSRFNATLTIDREQFARLKERHLVLAFLNPDDSAALLACANELLRRVHIDFHPELESDADLRGAVAVLAALPVLHRGFGWYAGLRSIYLVPRYYETETSYVDEAGVVHEGREEASGEMAEQGPVVLSAPDIASSGQGTGYNVVIHEMAHIVDLTNGELDGVPALPQEIDPTQWRRELEGAYREHCRRVRRGTELIDPYGAENRAEFFACATELFFERPRRLERGHPELWRQMRALYGFSPGRE